MDFKIGDELFYSHFSSHQQVWVLCPECLGSGRLRIILATEEEVSIACQCCDRGWEGSPGKISTYEPVADVWTATITGVESELGRKTQYRFKHAGITYIADNGRLFKTEEGAIDSSRALVEEHKKGLERQLGDKVKGYRNWAWHVYYHKRAIRSAEKDIERHKASLAIADKKAGV